ncbi:MAG: preprotein translocase subunit SecE [Planctomycetota bacterium]
MFEFYKRGQGRYVRIITFVAAMVITAVGVAELSVKLKPYVGTYVRFGVPAALVVLVGLLLFRVVNRQKSADFLIATESEMKKVSWSSKKEIVGSTKVVIVTTFILAGLLFGVDMIFVLVFRWTGIMPKGPS